MRGKVGSAHLVGAQQGQAVPRAHAGHRAQVRRHRGRPRHGRRVPRGVLVLVAVAARGQRGQRREPPQKTRQRELRLGVGGVRAAAAATATTTTTAAAAAAAGRRGRRGDARLRQELVHCGAVERSRSQSEEGRGAAAQESAPSATARRKD
jgi:hypothetical protein